MTDIMDRSIKNAIQVNPNVFTYPTTSDINITDHGSDLYWALSGTMGLSTIIFLGLGFRVDRTQRIFHHITALITLVATIAYFSMASNLGYASIAVEFQRSNPVVRGTYREIFYVRYIDWVITTPLLLTDLLLTCGMPWQQFVYTLIIDEVMIVTGLVGALVSTSYKWGYFVIAMVALFFVAHNVVWVGLRYARVLGQDTYTAYRVCGGWTIFLWFIYPIAWGLCEGGNIISPDSEAAFYSDLDVLAKPVFGALLLYFHRKIDTADLGLKSRDYDSGPNEQGRGHDNNNAANSQTGGAIDANVPGNGQNPSANGQSGSEDGINRPSNAGNRIRRGFSQVWAEYWRDYSTAAPSNTSSQSRMLVVNQPSASLGPPTQGTDGARPTAAILRNGLSQNYPNTPFGVGQTNPDNEKEEI